METSGDSGPISTLSLRLPGTPTFPLVARGSKGRGVRTDGVRWEIEDSGGKVGTRVLGCNLGGRERVDTPGEWRQKEFPLADRT